MSGTTASSSRPLDPRPDLAAELDAHIAAADAFRDLLPTVEVLAERLIAVLAGGGAVLAFGNGGSAADAQHLVAELVGRFGAHRPPLRAIALTTDPSVVTCLVNDFPPDRLFARQVEAMARPGDAAIGFTTSGRSANVVAGLEAARAAGALAVALCGSDGGPAADAADLALCVPVRATARVQELHGLTVHLVAAVVDAWASGRPSP
jgi:D-sedoheptulose 7-phosphate isomerase